VEPKGSTVFLPRYVLTDLESEAATATASHPEPERFLEVDEVARRLSLSRDFVYKLAKSGKLPFARRIGRTVRFSETGLSAWIKNGAGKKGGRT
jgi:excisionase family DNA binding protein